MDNPKMTRRSLIGQSLAALAAVRVSSAVRALGSEEADQTDPAQRKILTRMLGKTGVELPIISMGVMNSDNPSLVRQALERGIIHFDTAPGYLNGNSERMLGEVMQRRPRDSFVLATKAEPEWDLSRGWGERKVAATSTASILLKKLDQSLKRLRLDHVDIFYLHAIRDRAGALTDHLLEGLVTAKKQGKTRFVGVSTHDNMPAVIRAAVDSDVYEVVLTSYNFKMHGWKEMDDAMAAAQAKGIGLIAMKTQAGVYWDRERKHPINMKAALKYVLQNPAICTCIPGVTTFEQLELNLSVMADPALTPQEIEDLRAGESLKQTGLSCVGCSGCSGACREGLDIPTLMRSYMYAYGYRDLSLARAALAPLTAVARPCVSCDPCAVRCRLGIDVRSRVTDIARLRSLPEDLLA
jgi:predicted aldo/keto reductase-like oxidoreductase